METFHGDIWYMYTKTWRFPQYEEMDLVGYEQEFCGIGRQEKKTVHNYTEKTCLPQEDG